MAFSYFKNNRFDKIIYAQDTDGNVYFYEIYSWIPYPCWLRVTWNSEAAVLCHDKISVIRSLLDNPDKTTQITPEDLSRMKVPQINQVTCRDQLPHVYFQDQEEIWLCYAGDEKNNIYVYRNIHDPSLKNDEDTKKWPGKWELVTDEGFRKYCIGNMMTLSQSTPRNELVLKKMDIPLVNENEVVEFRKFS